MHTRHRRDDAELHALVVAIDRARATALAGRAGAFDAATWQAQIDRCGRLADLIEIFAVAAARSGVPLPGRYRDELRLYRGLGERAR